MYLKREVIIDGTFLHCPLNQALGGVAISTTEQSLHVELILQDGEAGNNTQTVSRRILVVTSGRKRVAGLRNSW